MSDSEPRFSKNSPEPPASDDAATGRLIVVSGPSGVGKSTIVDGLAKAWPFKFSVSATTRAPRPDEESGIDYHFVNRAVFSAMADAGDFLEWAEYADNLYGTPRLAVLEALELGDNVLLDIEVQGAVQVMEAFPDAVTIFVMPPSMSELEQRLRGRQDTDESAIEGRMALAEMQITVGHERFGHQVVNDDVETAIQRIVRILELELPPDEGNLSEPESDNSQNL